jgi:hypothetical protein
VPNPYIATTYDDLFLFSCNSNNNKGLGQVMY